MVVGRADVARQWVHGLTMRRKLVLSALLTVVLVMLVAAVVSVRSLGGLADQDMDAMVSNASATAGALAGDLSGRTRDTVNLLARRGDIAAAVAGSDSAALVDTLVVEFQILKDADPAVVALDAVDSRGIVLAQGASPTRNGISLAGEPLLQGALAGRAGGGAWADPARNRVGVQAMAPLAFKQRIVGVLRVVAELGVDTARMVKEKTGAEIVVLVDGKVHAATLDGAQLDNLVPTEEVAARVRAGETVTVPLVVSGTSYQVGYIALAGARQAHAPLLAVLVTRERVETARRQMVGRYGLALAPTGLILAILAVWLARNLASPLAELRELARALAAGDFRRRGKVGGEDEIGLAARDLGEAVRDVGTAVELVAGHAGDLAAASELLRETSEILSADADGTTSESARVSRAAEQVSTSIHSVAAATEEMSASVREIARSAHHAAGVAQRGVELTDRAKATVLRLGESGARIDAIVRLITRIADQTKMLALNATIEAARAGDAGRGFTVVASEVKGLAAETSAATKSISETVSSIQQETRLAIAAIAEITAVVVEIAETQGGIAAAVEEQTAIAGEIGRNVHEAAQGSQEIAEGIGGVTVTAERASSGAESTREAARQLAEMAGALRAVVARFRF